MQYITTHLMRAYYVQDWCRMATSIAPRGRASLMNTVNKDGPVTDDRPTSQQHLAL